MVDLAGNVSNTKNRKNGVHAAAGFKLDVDATVFPLSLGWWGTGSGDHVGFYDRNSDGSGTKTGVCFDGSLFGVGFICGLSECLHMVV